METDEEFKKRLEKHKRKKAVDEYFKKKKKSLINIKSIEIKNISIILILSLISIISFTLIDNINKTLKAPKPHNGETQIFTSNRAIADFQIQNKMNKDCLIKLTTPDNQTIMTIYSYKYSTISVKVPLGEYQTKYAMGNSWYGYDELFGYNTNFSKSKKRSIFYRNNYNISSNNLVLYSSIGSTNLKDINKNEF